MADNDQQSFLDNQSRRDALTRALIVGEESGISKRTVGEIVAATKAQLQRGACSPRPSSAPDHKI